LAPTADASYGILSLFVIVLIIDYPNYDPRKSLITLKAGPVERCMLVLVYFYGCLRGEIALSVLKGMLWLLYIANAIDVVEALNIPNLGLMQERSDDRLLGQIGQLSQYAAFLAMFLPLTVALYRTEANWRRVLAGLGLVFHVGHLLWPCREVPLWD
jgi:hypothetical protein